MDFREELGGVGSLGFLTLAFPPSTTPFAAQRPTIARLLKRAKRDSEDLQRPLHGNRAGERVGESLVALVGCSLGWSLRRAARSRPFPSGSGEAAEVVSKRQDPTLWMRRPNDVPLGSIF